jgi:hypothetical protein
VTPAKLPASRPGARHYASFLGYLAAGVVLAALLYEVLRYVALAIDKGVMP